MESKHTERPETEFPSTSTPDNNVNEDVEEKKEQN